MTHQVTSLSDYDAYGNAKTVTTTSDNLPSATVTTNYDNDTAQWILGRVKDVTMLLVLFMSSIAAVFAVVARGPAYRDAVVFWYPWSCYVVAQAIYIVRRAILLHRGQQALFALSDRVILGAVYTFQRAAFVILLIKRLVM